MKKFIALFVVLLAGCGAESPGGQTDGDNALVENRGAGKDEWWSALPRDAWQQYERVLESEEWFEVYKVADGIFAIYEPGQFEEVISFLVLGSERALLFDTGLGIGNIRVVVDALTDLDVLVLNSHTHYDHIGGNHLFDQVLGRDTPFTRGRAAGSGPEAVAEFIGPGWVWKPLPAGFDAAGYRSEPFEIATVVDDGYEIALGDRTLEVLVTPGHAPDSLCLIDRENRLLFTGDTFYLAPLYTHLEGSDFNLYVETARRLAGLAGDVDRVFTAHNVPAVDSQYLVELGSAFETIVSGGGAYVLTDGNREYDFGDFSVIVSDDLATE